MVSWSYWTSNMHQKISIIIPVSRSQKAQKAEESVLAQDYPGLEVIKVDAKGLSPAEARNKGAKKARGEILLFLDDDCEAQENWLRENLKALAEPKAGAVGSRVQGKSGKYFARSLDFANFTFAQSTKRREMPVCTASLAIKKEVFQKVRGFNEKMRVGEDTDLCMRLRRLGYKTIYEPRIKVLHDHGRETLKSFLSYQYNNGRVKGLTIEGRYPDNLWFLFLKKISYPGIYWLFILPFAILATLIAVLVNLRDYPKVIFYSPGIFLGKLACQVGIFAWTLKKPLILA